MVVTAYDDRPTEARVSINYLNKKIDIEHRTSKKDAAWYVANCIIPTMCSASYFFMLGFAPIIFFFSATAVLLGILPKYLSIYLFKIFIIIFFVGVCGPFVIGWLGLDAKFRSKVFPKFGAWVHKLHGRQTTLIITSENIKGNQVLVPDFRNAFITYEAYNDFKAKLAEVNITESPVHYLELRSDWRCLHWQAVFKFTAKPKNGFMVVRYI